MRAVVLLLAVLFLAGCGPEATQWWESTAAGDRLFLLNKRTGEVYTVQNGEVRPVERNAGEPWQGPEEPVDHERIARRHSPERSQRLFDDVLEVEVRTRYRNGEAEIRGSVTPFMSDLEKLGEGKVFTLELTESEGFRVVVIPINREDLIGTVGDDNKPLRFSFTKRVKIGAEDWREAAFLNVGWTASSGKAITSWMSRNPKDVAARQELARVEAEERRKEIHAYRASLREENELPAVGANPPEARSNQSVD